jgi:hypothetical protein
MMIMQRPWAGLRSKATQLGLETRDMLEARWRLEEIKKRMQEVLEV